MKINELKYIRALVDNGVEKAIVNDRCEGHAIETIVGDIIYTFFWDYEADKPTVDYDLWWRFIHNTTRTLYQEKVAQRA